MTTPPAKPDTDLDREMDSLAKAYAQGFGRLSGSPVFRAHLVRTAVAYAVIAIEDEFPDCKDVIEDELTNQAAILKLDS